MKGNKIKKDQVVNLFAACNAISNAVGEAEQMSGCPIKSIVVGIGAYSDEVGRAFQLHEKQESI